MKKKSQYFPGKKRRFYGKNFKKKKPLKIKPGAEAALKNVFAGIGKPEQSIFIPDSFQLESIEAILAGDCLVTAPTGAGKTWIAEKAIKAILERGGKAWYASPLKALSNSKHIEFSQIFGNHNVGILTGDRKENTNASVIVGTTEILRNHLYDAMHLGKDLETDLVILDEAHYLGDTDRGVVWEEVMIYLPERIPLLMLSATIGNADQIAKWLTSIRGKKCYVVEEKKRPVPLFPLFFHPSGKLMPLFAGKSSKTKTKIFGRVREYIFQKNQPSLELVHNLPPFGDILKVLRKYRLLPAIFFLKSRADCDNALRLCHENRHHPDRVKKLPLIREHMAKMTSKSTHLKNHRHRWILENTGVASHHSGHLPAWKLLVESSMTQGLLDAVFATSTVAAGVNFPARTVVFFNSDRFNGREFISLTSTQFHQMTGRAGRRGMDKIGFALAIPGKFMDIQLVARLYGLKPSFVSSQITINFSMVLNLLLSHPPEQIKELLEKSFATFLFKNSKSGKKGSMEKSSAHLWQYFIKHLNFLKETGYVKSDGTLSDDGFWASKLRVDQPLLIAQGLRSGIFPSSDPAILVGIMASFVNEEETDERIDKNLIPDHLYETWLDIKNKLLPFVKLMFEKGFEVRPVYLRPAVTLYAWAIGCPWEDVIEISKMAEGNLAMLILRTADNLRHIKALSSFFPEAAQTASKAVDMIMKDPVVTAL